MKIQEKNLAGGGGRRKISEGEKTFNATERIVHYQRLYIGCWKTTDKKEQNPTVSFAEITCPKVWSGCSKLWKGAYDWNYRYHFPFAQRTPPVNLKLIGKKSMATFALKIGRGRGVWVATSPLFLPSYTSKVLYDCPSSKVLYTDVSAKEFARRWTEGTWETMAHFVSQIT